jgi:hypothetical protein
VENKEVEESTGLESESATSAVKIEGDAVVMMPDNGTVATPITTPMVKDNAQLHALLAIVRGATSPMVLPTLDDAEKEAEMAAAHPPKRARTESSTNKSLNPSHRRRRGSRSHRGGEDDFDESDEEEEEDYEADGDAVEYDDQSDYEEEEDAYARASRSHSPDNIANNGDGSAAGETVIGNESGTERHTTGKGCTVPGCEGNRYARGFCSKHWNHWKKRALSTSEQDGSSPRSTSATRYQESERGVQGSAEPQVQLNCSICTQTFRFRSKYMKHILWHRGGWQQMSMLLFPF